MKPRTKSLLLPILLIFSAQADTADLDSDGFQTLEEYICGTGPTNGASYFQIGSSADGIQIPSNTNRFYRVTVQLP